MTEQRQYSRIDFNTRVTLGNDESLWEVRVIDLSLNGLLIHRPEHWSASIGDAYDMDLLLDEAGDSFVVMRCKVAWVSDDRVGLERIEIGLDSMTHLRRIIELNTGDADRVNREFSNLGIG